MMKIDGSEITDHHIEWGVMFHTDSTGEVEPMAHEEDARFWASLDDSNKLMVRHVYETAWAEFAEPEEPK